MAQILVFLWSMVLASCFLTTMYKYYKKPRSKLVETVTAFVVVWLAVCSIVQAYYPSSHIITHYLALLFSYLVFLVVVLNKEKYVTPLLVAMTLPIVLYIASEMVLKLL